VSQAIPMMHRIEHSKLGLPRRIQDLQHMRDTSVAFCDIPQAVPYLPSLGNEVVVRVDHKKCSELLVKRHDSLPRTQRQPNVNANASTPASRNSIANVRSTMGFGCR